MTKNQYNFNEQILNTLIVRQDGRYRASVRGSCRTHGPGSSSWGNPSSWGIWIDRPRMPHTKDEEEDDRKNLALGGGTHVCTSVADKYASWDMHGLTKFRDTINEVLALWKDFANQEAENLAKENNNESH